VHDLNYFIPCRAKDRVIAYIALGRTQNGDYLTSEDLELLETVSDYVGIALENARLYQSVQQKAVMSASWWKMLMAELSVGTKRSNI
jgi:hypothetical protein